MRTNYLCYLAKITEIQWSIDLAVGGGGEGGQLPIE